MCEEEYSESGQPKQRAAGHGGVLASKCSYSHLLYIPYQNIILLSGSLEGAVMRRDEGGAGRGARGSGDERTS